MDEIHFIRKAIELALQAEEEGNLPVGAVITLHGKLVAEGRSRIFDPKIDLTRHAEMEVLKTLPQEFWNSPEKLCLFTTLEPCLMCLGAILLSGVGRVVFGSVDSYGGAECVRPNLPQFFQERFDAIEWVGPILPKECDPLHQRLRLIEISKESDQDT